MDMKSIQVKSIPMPDISISEMSALLDEVPEYVLENSPWNESGNLPKVNFSIAYHLNGLGIKYRVKETFFKLEYNRTNEPVYQDSCVEFFVSVADDSYLNFEFNAAGVCLAQSGTGRNDREFLSSGEINSIQRIALINVEQSKKPAYLWSLTVFIPWKVLKQTSVPAQLKVNFYKCGDRLPEPHYLCWNIVESEKPDFHRPEYFGCLNFEK